MKIRWLCALLTWLRGTGLVDKDSELGKRLFSTHQARCPTCRQEWTAEELVVEQLRRTAAIYRRTPPPTLTYRIQAQIRAAIPPSQPCPQNLFLLRPQWVAAGLSLLLGIAGLSVWWHQHQKPPLAPVEQMVLLGQTFYEIAIPSTQTGMIQLLRPIQDTYRTQLHQWAQAVQHQAQTTLQSCLPQPELLGLPPFPTQPSKTE